MDTATTLLELPTPALILDRSRLERNLAAMATRMGSLGVELRPHLKTAKCVEVARRATGSGPRRLTVSTLAEAEGFAEAGFDDLLYAVCLAPGRFDRAARLGAKGVGLGVLLDDLEVARALAAHGAPFEVHLELDVGEHRTGVDPRGDELLELARVVHAAPTLRLAGVVSHAGQAYDARPADLAAVAEEERRLSVLAAERLTRAGLPRPRVSTGSTPTASAVTRGDGVDEMRPGVYVFGDLFQAGLGTCAVEDVALSVLATVISRRVIDGRRQLVLDAGGLALSKDRSTAASPRDEGYGRVVDLDGTSLGPLRVDGVHQEHGEVRDVPAALYDRLAPGTRVRVLPNHACMTAAAHEGYHVVEGSSLEVLDHWPRLNGW